MATDLASSKKIDISEYNPSNIFACARGIGLSASRTEYTSAKTGEYP